MAIQYTVKLHSLSLYDNQTIGQIYCEIIEKKNII